MSKPVVVSFRPHTRHVDEDQLTPPAAGVPVGPTEYAAVPAYSPSTPERPAWKRVTGPPSAAGALLAKWGVVLFKLKVFTFAASMRVAIVAYAWLWGWRLIAGFVGRLVV